MHTFQVKLKLKPGNLSEVLQISCLDVQTTSIYEFQELFKKIGLHFIPENFNELSFLRLTESSVIRQKGLITQIPHKHGHNHVVMPLAVVVMSTSKFQEPLFF